MAEEIKNPTGYAEQGSIIAQEIKKQQVPHNLGIRAQEIKKPAGSKELAG